MKKLKKFRYFSIIIFFSFTNLVLVYAEQLQRPRSLKGIEFLGGFGVAKLRGKPSYHVSPLCIDIDFDLKPLTKKINFNPPVLCEFVLEPFLAYVSQPNNNAEIGNNFLLKIGLLPETVKIQPYLKGGIGLIYLTQHTNEQSTQFNFNQYAGLGTHLFLNQHTSLTVEYRYRHISNAGIDHPNKGIDTNLGFSGISHRF